MKNHYRTMIAVAVFAIAMAALESAVVVYLRALYYPGEFTVALKLIEERILLVEIAREAATLVMLAAIGYIAGKTFKDRFAYFLLSFAVWDIFYYAWLKVFIDWPATILDWDILFLIPITWLGPVLAPIICSVTMILLAMVILNKQETYRISSRAWFFLSLGSVLMLFTFVEDYAGIVINNDLLADYANIMKNEKFIQIASHYIPNSYNWAVFSLGELFILAGTNMIYRSERSIRLVDGIMKLIPRT